MEQDRQAGLERCIRTIVGACVYAGAGMMFEVAFTGLGRGPEHSFRGGVSLEMLPVWYAYAVVIEPVLKSIRRAVDHLGVDGLLTWKGFWALVGNRQ